jgi:hypothetical protein
VPYSVHTYKIRDAKGRTLNDHCAIWLLELQKFTAPQIENEQQRWLRFFSEGEQLDDDAGLPDWMTTTEMRQAMSTLRQFSEKDRDYHAYQARQNFLCEQLSRQQELDEERQAKLEAIQREQAAAVREQAGAVREQAAAVREQAALKEIERLKALLAQKE